MKKYIVEYNTSKKFQPAQTVAVATVEATSKKAAIAAWKFYLKSGLSPVDAQVTPIGRDNYDYTCAFTAYEA